MITDTGPFPNISGQYTGGPSRTMRVGGAI